jgi:hypothetical protein
MKKRDLTHSRQQTLRGELGLLQSPSDTCRRQSAGAQWPALEAEGDALRGWGRACHCWCGTHVLKVDRTLTVASSGGLKTYKV